MKYLESFGSFSEVAEPVMFYTNLKPDSEENNQHKYRYYTSNREEWDEYQKKQMVEVVGRSQKVRGIQYGEVYNRPGMEVFPIEMVDYEKRQTYEVTCHKGVDEVYLVQLFKTDPTVDIRWYCDGFDCLIKLLKTIG